MTALSVIGEALADGVRLTLSSSEKIKVTGNGAAIKRQVSLISEKKPQILEYLRTVDEEKSIRNWLARIDETDPLLVANVIERCQQDADDRAYFLKQAKD